MPDWRLRNALGLLQKLRSGGNMGLETVVDWLTWLGVVIPLVVLACQGWRYVNIQKDAGRQQEFVNFFHTLERVNNKDGSLILQMAAIFELRNYPKYKDVILKICDDAQSIFSTDDLRVLDQFEATASFLRAIKK